MEGREGRQPSLPPPEGDDEFTLPHLLTRKEMPHTTEGKRGGDGHPPGAAVARQYISGKAPDHEQDMPGPREQEHHKLVEEDLIYEKRQYRKKTHPSPAKAVK
jgi:hypothetical protein